MITKVMMNMVVNTLSFLVCLGMVVTGLILKFVLPPGSGRAEMLFRGGRNKTIELYMGLTRHEWGNIHFIVVLVFLSFLSLHLILHWPWIRVVAWGTPGHPLPWRRRWITIGVLLLTGGILALPWIQPTQSLQREEYRMLQRK